VVTSKSMRMAMRGLERFGLERFFPVVISADCVTTHKPDPHPLCFAAERLGLPAEKCAYVGDSPHDMAASVAAGSVSIAALWGGFTRERVLEPCPEYAASSINDVVAILEGHESAYRVSYVTA